MATIPHVFASATSPLPLSQLDDNFTSLTVFTPSGTGAVPTTVQAKLSESVSVKDFGAVGDGVTDDTTSIQNALAYAATIAILSGTGCSVFAPKGQYKITGQLVCKKGVSLIGDGGRSTVFKLGSTFTGLTTSGAIRIGDGTASTFGANIKDFLIECNGIAGSIGVYSSDMQDGSISNITVNNFVSTGFLLNGAGGTFGSVNGFELDGCQAFKADTGGTSGFGFFIQNGTFPSSIKNCQVYGHVANPILHGYYALNIPVNIMASNVDGYGTNGIFIDTTCPIASVMGFTANGTWTQAINITSNNPVTLIGIYRVGGTYTVLDFGNGGGVVKGVTDTLVPFYTRGANAANVDKINVNNTANFYANLNIVGNSALVPSLNITAGSASAGGFNHAEIHMRDNTGTTGWNLVEVGNGSNAFNFDRYTANVFQNTALNLDPYDNIYGIAGSTTAVGGFLHIPSAAGAPTGIPVVIAGRIPLYYDRTNNFLYVYNGAWKKSTVYA